MSIIINFGIRGAISLDNKIKKREQKLKREKKRAVDVTALAIVGHAQKAIQRGPKTGAVYGDHQASAPGEPPASDTGNLARSITVDGLTTEDSAVITVRSPYAAALEFGTDDGKIAERPFLRPAVAAHKQMLIDLLKEALHGD